MSLVKSRYSLVLALFIALPLAAIDREFLAAWERTQKQQPRTLTSSARIAPVGEPGDPLTIRGRVVDAQGRAIRDAVVFAYHTDRTGVYDKPGTPAHSWRLRGWVITDARGGFTFETIRPARYPDRSVPAHVHFTVVRSNGSRYFANDLEFADNDRSRTANVLLKLDEGQRF